MSTWIRRERTIETQKRAPFTGEGAYHGSVLKPRPVPIGPPPVPEATPYTLERYERMGKTEVDEFDAYFDNSYEVQHQLPIPTQEEVRTDGVEFCWATLEEALQLAGPLTLSVLLAMQDSLTGSRKHVYVDSKIQYFEPGDLPVDSKLWHIDGVTAVRGERPGRFGWPIVQDLRARLDGYEDRVHPFYLTYQSSTHCATQFLDWPLWVRVPELMRNFDVLDTAVRSQRPPEIAQPAGSIVAFNGLTLHRAVPAEEAGWRLWIRLTETDREITPDPSMLDCYGTVFATGEA